MKIPLLSLVLSLGTAVGLVAQEAETGSEERAPRGRVASFVFTSLPEGFENPVTVLAGKEVSEVLLSKFSPSDSVKVPADGILRIVRQVENAAAAETPQYQTLAQASVPESVSKAVVILMPMAENPQGLLFKTQVLDLDAYKGGESMFLNMTNFRIGIELGKSKFVVEPGKLRSHNPLGSERSASLPIRLSYFHPTREEWSMITASTVALYSTRRELCIFNWDANFNRVDYESLTLPSL
ncbi:hypothetical protein HAHE_01700 [Haloferula helveola]|uniref:Uncharacterized protein n=1 Tax=Haloferula helveola TaxID=490095 RepID=A0ABM7RCC1_9BACT|nr:hypothetical protein HAHE_01700 [Haloferula helveola]